MKFKCWSHDYEYETDAKTYEVDSPSDAAELHAEQFDDDGGGEYSFAKSNGDKLVFVRDGKGGITAWKIFGDWSPTYTAYEGVVPDVIPQGQ